MTHRSQLELHIIVFKFALMTCGNLIPILGIKTLNTPWQMKNDRKITLGASTLKGSRNRYTRTFSTIWVSINFYFFRRIQKKCFHNHWRHLNGVFFNHFDDALRFIFPYLLVGAFKKKCIIIHFFCNQKNVYRKGI